MMRELPVARRGARPRRVDRSGAALRGGLAVAVALAGMACIGPSDRRPGLWLDGERQEQLPSDWSFSDEHREIAIEVRTPYLLPHSVTIWCAAAAGRLFVAARSPETKRWPGWVDRHPEVRLRIGERVYDARLVPLEDPDEIALVRQAYAVKYELPATPAEGGPPVRYWVVQPAR